MAGELESELERYADLLVALAEPAVVRDEVLAQHDLDEDGWERYDAAWQRRLSDDERASDARGEIPPLWVAFSLALQQAQERRQTKLLELERYAALARVLARGGDVTSALKEQGVSLLAFLEAHRHWIQRATTDDDIATQLAKLLA